MFSPFTDLKDFISSEIFDLISASDLILVLLMLFVTIEYLVRFC